MPDQPIIEEEKIREVHGFQCQFCGTILPTKEEAELCWQRHIQFQFEPLFTLEQEFPIEILIKKMEGSFYTEVATYVYEKKEKVHLPVKGEKTSE